MRYYVTESKLSGVFSETFFLMKKNFVPLLVANLILAVFSIGITVLSETVTAFASLSYTGYYVQSMIYSLLSLLISCLLLFLVSPFVSAFCKVRCFSTMGGASLTFSQTFRAAKIKFPYTLTSLLCMAVLSLALVPVIVVIVLLGTLYGFTAPSSMTVFIIVVSIIMLGIVYLAMHFALVSDIAANEELHGFKAVFKSFRLITKGNYGKNVGHLLLYYGILFAIELILAFFVVSPLSLAGYYWIAICISFPVTTIVSMFTSCYLSVIYKNASLHMEGYAHFPYAVLLDDIGSDSSAKYPGDFQ